MKGVEKWLRVRRTKNCLLGSGRQQQLLRVENAN
jgi:hypothetical protein